MNQSLSQLLNCIFDNENTVNSYAIDVGAHFGEYTKFLITTGFFSHVLSFEPKPESYSTLLDQVTSTGDCEHYAINAALSNESGVLDLYCDADAATASLLNYVSNYVNDGQIKTYSVPVVSLDEYLANNSFFGKLNLLKIDTQGNDLSVVEGAVNTIALHRPIIQTEFIYIPLYEGQCSPVELSEKICALNYEIYSLNNIHVTEEGRLAFCDAIFVPKELEIPSTPKYSCIDDQVSYKSQINMLTQICAERLMLIERLDAEIQHLSNKTKPLMTILRKVRSWVQ